MPVGRTMLVVEYYDSQTVCYIDVTGMDINAVKEWVEDGPWCVTATVEPMDWTSWPDFVKDTTDDRQTVRRAAGLAIAREDVPCP